MEKSIIRRGAVIMPRQVSIQKLGNAGSVVKRKQLMQGGGNLCANAFFASYRYKFPSVDFESVFFTSIASPKGRDENR